MQSDCVTDWNLSPYFVIEPHNRVDIIQDQDSHYNKGMRGYFAEGTYLVKEHGFFWSSPFTDAQNEMYFSYDIKFKPGFEWVKGGKIPGLTGGRFVSGMIPSPTDGFSVRMMWKENGKLTFYVYHQNQSDIYGDSYLWGNFAFTSGKWYNITIRVVLNTVKDGIALNNGILEGFIDGKLLFQKKDFKFRSLESIKIENMNIGSFFGGNTPDWAATRDESIDMDNFVAYLYSDKLTNVPRGYELNSTTKALIHPYLNIPDAEWKKSIKLNSVSLSEVSLSWNDFPVPANYILERQQEGNTSFTSIATLTYGTKSYSDKGLKSGTTYIYRIKAGQSTSNQLSVKTVVPLLPNAPDVLSLTSSTKSSISLKWQDNAINEQGFILERSVSSTGGFAQIVSLAANSLVYIDNNLLPSTTYYYRIKAFNNDGSSAYSSVLTAITNSLQIPLAPTGLIATQINYTWAKILWVDKSVNETGFELERSGPDNLSIKTILKLDANKVSYTDSNMVMDGVYQYRIRAANLDGSSAWSNVIEIVTPLILPPVAPTKLKSTKFTDKSISVSWMDNSINEAGFIITRSLANDSTTTIPINIRANDTAYTDTSLVPSTTYLYTIKAINLGGSSSISNRNVATTLSKAELKRIKKDLVAYYNFGYNPDYIIYDQSGYSDPVNLRVLDRSAIQWNEDNTLDVLSNTALVSMIPATKIIHALKSTNEITFECWLKPKAPSISMSSRIVSLGNSDDDIGFLLDQTSSGEPTNESLNYSVRFQTASTIESGYPVYNPDREQTCINLQHLVYIRDKQGKENFYLNGKESSYGYRPSNLNTWKNDYYLRLGNESDMDHSWTGSYYSVAIYNRALSLAEITTNFNAGPCDSIQNTEISCIIELFPNPVSDQGTISITPENYSDFVPLTSMQLINIFGEVIFQENIFDLGLRFTKTIDFSKYQPGVYILIVRSGKKQKTKKVIVQ